MRHQPTGGQIVDRRAAALVPRCLAFALVATAAAFLAGCGNTLPPGTAGLKVTAVAEPKAGYRQPADVGGGYSAGADGAETAASARADPYRLLDYRNLEDIVVYVVPDAGTAVGPPAAAPQPVPVTVDAGTADGRGRRGVNVTKVDGLLVVENTAARPANCYCRTEAGKLIDLGTIPPAGSAHHVLTEAGPLTVYREADGPDDERLATVFVAPVGWARKAVAGETVTFGPLPPGRYLVSTWHPRLPGSRSVVDLPAGQYTTATATVGVNALPKVP